MLFRSGATIYCEMVGGGMSADAYHITAPHPEGLGALNVMKSALSDAEMDPSEVDYVNVHGTSTPLGESPSRLSQSRCASTAALGVANKSK